MEGDPKEVTQDIKVAVRSVLLSQKGVKIERFLRDFRSLMGFSLDFKKLGFRSLRMFINAIPDVARIEYCNKEKTDKLYAIADPNSYLSEALKKNLAGSRGDSKNRNNNKIKDDPSTPKGEDPIPGELAAEYRSQLMPNMKKLYAICFPKRNLTREHISTVFGEFGNLAETSFTDRFVFVRYYDREHAIKALLKLKDEYFIKIPTEHMAPRHVIKEGGNFTKKTVPGDKTCDVYLGNLANGVNMNKVLQMLAGIVIRNVRQNAKDGKNFCFLTVDSEENAEEVVRRLNGKEFNGQAVMAQVSFKHRDKGRHENEIHSDDPKILQNVSKYGEMKLTVSIGDRDENASDEETNVAPATSSAAVNEYDDMPCLEELDDEWDETEAESAGYLAHQMAGLTVTSPKAGGQNQGHVQPSPVRPNPPRVSPSRPSPARSSPARPNPAAAKQGNVSPLNSAVKNSPIYPMGRGAPRRVTTAAAVSASLSAGRGQGQGQHQTTNEVDDLAALNAIMSGAKKKSEETPKTKSVTVGPSSPPQPPATNTETVASPGREEQPIRTPKKIYEAAVRVTNFCYETTQEELWDIFRHSNPARIVVKPIIYGETSRAMLLYDNVNDAYSVQAMDGIVVRGRRLYISLSELHHKPDLLKASNIACTVRQTEDGGDERNIQLQHAPIAASMPQNRHASPMHHPMHPGYHHPGPHGDSRHHDYSTGPGPHQFPGHTYPGSPPGAHGDTPQAPIHGHRSTEPYMKRGLLGDSPASHGGNMNGFGRNPALEANMAMQGHTPGYHGHKSPSMHHGYRGGDMRGHHSPHVAPGFSHHNAPRPHASYHQSPPEVTPTPPTSLSPPSHGHAKTTPRELAMQMHISRMAEECFPGAVALYTPEDLEEEICILLTSITDDAHFWGWVVTDDNMPDISDLMEKMSQVEGVKMPFDPNVPRCAAFHGGDWYRAYLVGIKPDGRAHVYLIDYGSEEMVPLDCMAVLPEDYWEMAPQAVPFRVIDNTSGSGLHGHMEGVVRACCIQHESGNENVIKVCLLELSLPNPLKPGVKLRMKI